MVSGEISEETREVEARSSERFPLKACHESKQQHLIKNDRSLNIHVEGNFSFSTNDSFDPYFSNLSGPRYWRL